MVRDESSPAARTGWLSPRPLDDQPHLYVGGDHSEEKTYEPKSLSSAVQEGIRCGLERRPLGEGYSLGVPPNIIQTLKSLYKELQSCVVLNEKRTRWFNLKVG